MNFKESLETLNGDQLTQVVGRCKLSHVYNGITFRLFLDNDEVYFKHLLSGEETVDPDLVDELRIVCRAIVHLAESVASENESEFKKAKATYKANFHKIKRGNHG